eukprot:363955-Chlamydomonas_euryale.AAC.4
MNCARRFDTPCPPISSITSGLMCRHTSTPPRSTWSMWCTTTVPSDVVDGPPTRRPDSTPATSGQRSARASCSAATMSAACSSSPTTTMPLPALQRSCARRRCSMSIVAAPLPASRSAPKPPAPAAASVEATCLGSCARGGERSTPETGAVKGR